MTDTKTETPTTKSENPFLKLIFELGPLAIFFLANAYWNIFVATACFMVATVLALVGSRIFFKKIPIMPLVTGFFVLIMGGLTLYLADDFFIKIKPTIVNLLFASILFGGLYFGRPLFKWLLGDAIHLADEGWHKLTFRWAGFFVVLAILNEIVWRNVSTDTWVSFKFFGVMPLTFIFAAAQIGLIQKYQVEPDEKLSQN